ncbi:MAG TPA: single-stranded DNA-binding protein [Blastocatellia bacterium]|nr:single-stranded DNA-binding protein [Blastocatellia bacterium]
MSFNKISILGNLGRDPELRYTPQGTAVCDFSMATSEKRRDSSGDQQDVTTWFRVTFWGKQAEIASQYLSKGKQVYVEGRLSQREWTDRDGNKRTSLEVNGTDLHFVGTRGDDAGGRQSEPASNTPRAASAPAPANDADDDIPF